ncbi:RHS repeat-associated core domain-containing protein [Anthocerotibacter panamensis]|uniref:RHS repeat-associated core domain-containing protein n=1 Tax=Anthocerotibacter panamensis TaxID=2857077 RepID=UPI001C401652|nr:RHS repeat-associated core domain-containing protein [Anthocerotibacter panamensis]
MIALTDDTGTIQTSYNYSPYGKKQTTGFASDSSYGFTAREDDGTGFYYYRARYYNPDQKRFVAEDPLEFGGGDSNFYAYVGSDPVNRTDPSGNGPMGAAAGALVGGATGTIVGGAGGTLALPGGGTIAGAAGLGQVGALAGGAIGSLTEDFGGVAGSALENLGSFIQNSFGSLFPAYNEVRNTPDQDAVIQLAKEAKRKGGVSPDEAKDLVDLAGQCGVPARGSEAHPNRPHGKNPHIHVGPVDHIPVR